MGSCLHQKLVVALIRQYSARDEHLFFSFWNAQQRYKIKIQYHSTNGRTNTEPNGMRLGLLLITFSALAVAVAATAIASQLAMRLRGPQGIDVSNWQKTIDWKKVKSQGVAFAYIKATEGTSTAYFHETRSPSSLRPCYRTQMGLTHTYVRHRFHKQLLFP
jgi:hypothetical protein